MNRASILVIAIVAGCARHHVQGPVAVRESAGRGCLNSLWHAGELRPRTVEIENQSRDAVLVFVEICRGFARVGSVGPRESRAFDLPSGTISYNGILRFLTHRGPRLDPAPEFANPTRDFHLRLVIPARPRPDCPEVWVNGRRVEGTARPIPRDQIESVSFIPTGPSGECSRFMIKLKNPKPS